MTIEQSVQIQVYSKQVYDHETEPDESITNHKGTLKIEGENIYLQYEDENGITYYKIDQKRQQISVFIKGTYRATLKFKPNTLTKAIYQTPIGNMTFDLKTQAIELAIQEIFQLTIRYVLSNQNEPISHHFLRLTI